ncbi:hypothetical protein FRC12_003181 [Ceratobasidium sp. 428]|nr:hypothetical protein FRC12_003181 [Ceratobasidium sp. 428]
MPLEFSDGIHLLDLRNTLAECPKLRSLALIECELWLSSEEPIQPVSLPDLEVLDLRVLADEDVLMFLISFILPGSNNLAFGISIHSSIPQYAMARLRDFMRRSNVTRLCIGADFITFINHLDWLLATPEDDIFTIQELALCGYRFSKPVDNQPLNANHFPFLHTLHLMGGSDLDADKCRQILDASKVQILRTDNSRELVAALSGIVPSVEYRRYFTICHGESDLEWPLYVLD